MARYTAGMPLLPSALPPKGEARRYVANDFLNLIALPNGEGCETRIPLFSHCQNKYTHMWKKNNDGQSLPRVGKVASGASRIGFWRYERERGNASQVDDMRKHPIHRWRGPPSPMGKATIREHRFSRIARANTRICGKTISTDKAFPAWGRWRAERAG